ncbi:hypothetical protein GCM10022422_01330 [Flavobacterium ginsengisoli]|uniref:Uncharacterized protein n=1 Tax=Flavobacterium ginsengisoli TaxID=871694 RepID=A0ABP7ESM9_9FLAO|nr:hypothetical protein [Flavobacterium ginsengisoli]
MSKINQIIIEKFDFFNDLVSKEKIILDDEISLKPKVNNIYWSTGESKTKHSTINEEIIFMVEQSKRDNKYGIKLRCENFLKQPFFRFDSDGPAHRNDDVNIPLHEQSIKTPHFNSFNEAGKSIAYHNHVLKDENQAKIIANDINFGISLFCQETDSKLKNSNFPTIAPLIPELEFSETNNIDFDNINFE